MSGLLMILINVFIIASSEGDKHELLYAVVNFKTSNLDQSPNQMEYIIIIIGEVDSNTQVRINFLRCYPKLYNRRRLEAVVYCK
jgi:thiamine monophosphate kinase